MKHCKTINQVRDRVDKINKRIGSKVIDFKDLPEENAVRFIDFDSWNIHHTEKTDEGLIRMVVQIRKILRYK